MFDTEKIKSIEKTPDSLKGHEKNDEFLLKEMEHFTGLSRETVRKSDRYTVFYSAATLFISGIYLLARIFAANVYLEGTYNALFFFVFACSYLFGFFVFIVIINAYKSNSYYSLLINSSRQYFIEKYSLNKNIEETYYRSIKFLKNNGISITGIVVFFFVNFLNGVFTAYFIFKNLTIPGSDNLSIVLCVLISLFLSYIYYFWFRTAVDASQEKTGLL